jgi:hypothetical protein
MYNWVQVLQIAAQLWVHSHSDVVEVKVLNIFLTNLLLAISAKVLLKWLVPHSFQESSKRQKGLGVLDGCKLFGNSPRLPYPSPFFFSFCLFLAKFSQIYFQNDFFSPPSRKILIIFLENLEIYLLGFNM